MNFAKIIHFHRKQAGLSRLELARLAGMGKTALYDLEKGKSTVRLDILSKVLTALNIELDWSSPLKDAMESVDRSILAESDEGGA
jgi:transcriptional regulator with XRE-family HTH domain